MQNADGVLQEYEDITGLALDDTGEALGSNSATASIIHGQNMGTDILSDGNVHHHSLFDTSTGEQMKPR